MTHLHFILASMITSLFLAGCGALSPRHDPSRFFTLSSLLHSETDFPKGDGSVEMISLGIGPVKFPGYLDRPEIVFRIAQNRFDLSENDRWAEPLDENFARVLAQNLSALLPSYMSVPYPWAGSAKPKYQVEIEVISFEMNRAREAHLSARWILSDGGSRKPVNLKVSHLVRSTKENSIDSSVAALSETVADLSREIADVVKAVDTGKKVITGK